MFSANSPGDHLQLTGWPLADLSVIKIHDGHDTPPPSSFWKLISMMPRLEEIALRACYVLEFLPFLFAKNDQVPNEAHVPFPFPSLLYLEITGAPSPDSGSGILLDPLLRALEKRCQATLDWGNSNIIRRLKSVSLMCCKSPPHKSLPAGVRFAPRLIETLHWEFGSVFVQSV